ncbi:MAG: hypothetical protein V3W43_06930 [Desulfatiglandaceae bacterium]
MLQKISAFFRKGTIIAYETEELMIFYELTFCEVLRLHPLAHSRLV